MARSTRGGVRGGFTLLDLMIVVVVLGILAAVTLPILGGHIERADDSAADTTHDMVRKALDLHFQKHGTWPGTIEPALFVNGEAVTMPEGYQLFYDPASGELDLNILAPEDAEGAPPIVYADAET